MIHFDDTCLPNGLSSAPRIFTKLLKPVFSKLRNEGFISVYDLDDSWLMGKTHEDCSVNVRATKQLLSNAGFIINEKKSVFEPVQRISFLGFNLDSVSMTVSLPEDKRKNIVDLCDVLNRPIPHKIRFVAKFIGVLVSSLPAVQYGALFYRFLERDKIRTLQIS